LPSPKLDMQQSKIPLHQTEVSDFPFARQTAEQIRL